MLDTPLRACSVLLDGTTRSVRINALYSLTTCPVLPPPATLSPAHTCHDESLNTLKYAERLCQVSSKNIQGRSGESSYGFPGTPSGSKEVMQLQQQNNAAQEKRDMYEYPNPNPSIQDSLGGNRPGTVAARMLLRRTINDPQQRLAKIGVHKPKYGTDSDPEDHRLSGSYDAYDAPLPTQSTTPLPKPQPTFNGVDVTAKKYDRLQAISKEIDQEKLEEQNASMSMELEGLKNAYRCTEIVVPHFFPLSYSILPTHP